MQQNATNSEKELSEKQVLAIPHLVSAKSFGETAELVGVNRTTIYRWMDDPTFREEYDRQRDAVAGFARAGMRSLMLKALAVQAERFDSDDPRERARAAKEIMDYDAKTAHKHESQKLLNRLHSVIYSTNNRVLDQPTINSELEQYLNSHQRH
ncbi:MAG: hypothetical protein F4W93_04420 [Dehalococcoidia bacterium]|nr:hypothetical protein [Dehalococcoidia bacterium]